MFVFCCHFIDILLRMVLEDVFEFMNELGILFMELFNFYVS